MSSSLLRKEYNEMNKKALLVLIPMLCVLSMLVVPAFATGITYPPTITASGWAVVKTNIGCVSGCATLWVFVDAPPPSDLVELQVVCGSTEYFFTWIINSYSLKCHVLTVCASPPTLIAITPASDPVYLVPLSGITITVYPYPATSMYVTALGCSTLFIGQGHTEEIA